MSANKMKAVFHPHLPSVSYEVPEVDAKGWKEQGWRFTDPKLPTPEPAPAHVDGPAPE